MTGRREGDTILHVGGEPANRQPLHTAFGEQRGTGLGLTICRKIVEEHGAGSA